MVSATTLERVKSSDWKVSLLQFRLFGSSLKVLAYLLIRLDLEHYREDVETSGASFALAVASNGYNGPPMNVPSSFLVPTELFPSDLRAQGNGFGITGWAIGVGWTTLVNPIIFGDLRSRTYCLYAGLNFLWIPIVCFFYPETAHRSLESIETLFASESPFFRQMEEIYHQNKDILERDVAADGLEKSTDSSMHQEFGLA